MTKKVLDLIRKTRKYGFVPKRDNVVVFGDMFVPAVKPPCQGRKKQIMGKRKIRVIQVFPSQLEKLQRRN